MNYREKIYLLRLSRKVLAARLHLTYTSLSSRLNGFTSWQGDEERALQSILNLAEAAQKVEAEKQVEGVVYRGGF